MSKIICPVDASPGQLARGRILLGHISNQQPIMLCELSPEVTYHLLSSPFFSRIGCAVNGGTSAFSFFIFWTTDHSVTTLTVSVVAPAALICLD